MNFLEHEVRDPAILRVTDRQDVFRMLRVSGGLVTRGLEVQEWVPRCSWCGREVGHYVSSERRLSTIICHRCRDAEKARERYERQVELARREAERERQDEALVQSLTKALTVAFATRRVPAPTAPPRMRQDFKRLNANLRRQQLRRLQRLDERAFASYQMTPPLIVKPKLWWISWIQPLLLDNQYFTSPTQICAWWRSAFFSGGSEVLSACVAAPTAREAKLAICGGWDKSPEWRFCESKPSGWRPNAVEFPIGRDSEARFATFFKDEKENASAMGQIVSFPLASV